MRAPDMNDTEAAEERPRPEAENTEAHACRSPCPPLPAPWPPASSVLSVLYRRTVSVADSCLRQRPGCHHAAIAQSRAATDGDTISALVREPRHAPLSLMFCHDRPLETCH